MKNFLRNSRPLPYKTLATGILFNGVISYNRKDINESKGIVIDNLKDGITILYFNEDIKTIATTENPVELCLTLQNYERIIFGPIYMGTINSLTVADMFRTLSYYDDGGNEVSIIIAKNKKFVYSWSLTIDGKEYNNGMPVLINKIGGLVFIEYFTEI